MADLAAGRIKQATLDQAVARVLRAKFLLGLFEHPYVQSTTPEPERPADRALALRAAEEAIVLLKNVKPTSPCHGAGRNARQHQKGPNDFPQRQRVFGMGV